MKYVLMVLLLQWTAVVSQEITWPESPGPITALEIYCDTDSIPIYLDGLQVGISPLREPVQVAPGWHQVSYFPQGNLKVTQGKAGSVAIADIVHLARQDILAEEGKTIRVVLSYRSIEAEVKDYQAKLDSSRWIGLAMALLTLLIVSWGII